MADSSYVAWDGKEYGGEPPEGWYLAADSRWWPEGYSPSPAEIASAQVAHRVSEGEPGGSAPDTDAGIGLGVNEATPLSSESPNLTAGQQLGRDSASIIGQGAQPSAGVGVPDVSGVGVPDVNVPGVNVPDAGVPDVNVPGVGVPDVKVPGVSDVNAQGGGQGIDDNRPNFGAVDRTEIDFGPPSLPGGTTKADDARTDKFKSSGASFSPPETPSNPGAFGGPDPLASTNVPGVTPSADVSTEGPSSGVSAAFPSPSTPGVLGQSNPSDGGVKGSTENLNTYAESTQPKKKSRKWLYILLIGLLLVVALAAVAIFSLKFQDDDSEGSGQEIDQTSENPGSYNKPQQFNEALNIFYEDGANSVEYRWEVQVVAPGSEVDSLEADQGRTLRAATVKIEFQEGTEGTVLDRLVFSSIGTDLAWTEIDADCTAELPDGMDLTEPVSPGDTVEGQLCWAVPENFADEQVLAISSPEAQGVIFFELS